MFHFNWESPSWSQFQLRYYNNKSYQMEFIMIFIYICFTFRIISMNEIIFKNHTQIFLALTNILVLQLFTKTIWNLLDLALFNFEPFKKIYQVKICLIYASHNVGNVYVFQSFCSKFDFLLLYFQFFGTLFWSFLPNINGTSVAQHCKTLLVLR